MAITGVQHTHAPFSSTLESGNHPSKTEKFSAIKKLFTCCFSPLSGAKPPDLESSINSSNFSFSVGSSGNLHMYKSRTAHEKKNIKAQEKRLFDTPMKRSLALLIERYNASNDSHKTFSNSKTASETISDALRKKDLTPSSAHLTDDEFLGLHMYTTSLYRPINHHLRYEPKSDVPLVVDAIQSGLKKLSQDPNNKVQGYLYRGIERKMSEDEILQRFRPNHIYQDTGFLSASFKPETARLFEGPVMLRIQGKTEANIQKISNHPHEQEAIFQPNTPFLVRDMNKNYTKNMWVVDLLELNEQQIEKLNQLNTKKASTSS